MDKETNKSRTLKRAQPRTGPIASEQIEKLVEAAPRFKALDNVVRGDNWRLTPEQQAFLDDFKSRLTQS